jgi:hypothetical protein
MRRITFTNICLRIGQGYHILITHTTMGIVVGGGCNKNILITERCYKNILITEGCNKSKIICGYIPKNSVKNIKGKRT